jgi:hypothetical protein
MGIDSFIDRKKDTNILSKFNELKKGKTKEEVRKLEQQLLKPGISHRFKNKSNNNLMDARTFKMVFLMTNL